MAQVVDANTKTVHVTGEFRADGTCEVFADGVPVFGPAESARTLYVHDGILGLPPAGFDAHEVWCGVRGFAQILTPLDINERSFLLLLYAPSGQLAQTRVYRVTFETVADTDAGRVVSAALFGMSRHESNDSTNVPVGRSYLSGISGTMEITQVDSEKIVGRFNFEATAIRTL